MIGFIAKESSMGMDHDSAYESHMNGMGSTNDERTTNAPLPLPPRPVMSQDTITAAGIVIPFQFLLHNCVPAVANRLISTPVMANPRMLQITTGFRYATLENIELVMFPNARAAETPISVAAVWTPADVAVVADNLLTVPGSTVFTAGSYSMSHSFVLPADLNYLNPVIKSPIPFVDSPRISAVVLRSPEAEAEANGYLLIRGNLRLSHPCAVPH